MTETTLRYSVGQRVYVTEHNSYVQDGNIKVGSGGYIVEVTPERFARFPYLVNYDMFDPEPLWTGENEIRAEDEE